MEASELQIRKEAAISAKAEGNRLFGEGLYHDAITAYSRPLETMMGEFLCSPAMMASVGSSLVGEIYDVLGRHIVRHQGRCLHAPVLQPLWHA